jgi:hypothetical protein
MRRFASLGCVAVFVLAAAQVATAQPPSNPYARDPKQAVDEQYTKKIKEYTTAPYFTSPLVDYLPASKTVPTPAAVLKDIAGAPGILPYSQEVYAYMRMVEKATPRVKVFSIGKTEEGREMIAVAVSSEANIAKLEENRARLAKLADPRTIGMNDGEADRLVDQSVPVYYITGTIHSPETGSPTALMELVYRLAVDDSPYIQKIRNRLVTLITPIVEVDGRDRHVDVYRWHLAKPGKNWPSTLYWGKYVAHDNNRDAMGLTLNLTRNVLNTFVAWHAQVLHDLHESVPYLYDNTAGDGPFNAWLDPILTDEWEMIGWHNVSEMTKFGMPGVFTHGTFDTWTPGYLMFIAATHNGISRLYETFGNAGADTIERTLMPNEFERTWYKQNPPLPKTKWSQRNNNNYQETGLLVSLNHFADNKNLFLKNFYLKSKRSILKAKTEGPAAYLFPGDDPRPGLQAELLRILQMQGCEISRTTAPLTVTIPAKKRPPARQTTSDTAASGSGGTTRDSEASAAPQERADQQKKEPSQPELRMFPAGSYVLRMDQPYSRIADMLLDYQYWAPDDPQRSPYDDTGWTFGELFNVKVVRVTDVKVLDGAMEAVKGEVKTPGSVTGSGSVFAINHNGDPALATLRYRLKDAKVDVAEEPFEAAGQKFSRGSFVLQGATAADLNAAASELGLKVVALDAAPSVKMHPARAARVAVMHTWLSTQDEGWWRLALDRIRVPYSYISTQSLTSDSDLRSKYDVILFPPVGRAAGQTIITGMPMYGNPLPWKTTSLTPNIGKLDSTDDIRPGMGWEGMANLQKFVRDGGVLVSVDDTADFSVAFGLTPGVSVTRPQRLKITGAVLRSKLVDGASPIAYGYDDGPSIYSSDGPIFGISNFVGGRAGRPSPGGDDQRRRATGRGTIDDPDQPQGRPVADPAPEEPRVDPWQAAPVRDEQLRNGINVIPPAQRPRVVFRYGDSRDLLVSGLLDGGNEIAQHPMVVDVPAGKGHVVLFSNNPIWRGETQGNYAMVLNAIMNFDNLDAGRKLDEK